MAIKIKTNKSKQKKTVSATGSAKEKPTYNVESIENGFIVTKSWTDEKGMYQTKKRYHETNPLEKDIV